MCRKAEQILKVNLPSLKSQKIASSTNVMRQAAAISRTPHFSLFKIALSVPMLRSSCRGIERLLCFAFDRRFIKGMIVNRGREHCTDPITVDDGRDKYGIGGISYSFPENVLPRSANRIFCNEADECSFL